jgi:hypothetical protein
LILKFLYMIAVNLCDLETLKDKEGERRGLLFENG